MGRREEGERARLPPYQTMFILVGGRRSEAPLLPPTKINITNKERRKGGEARPFPLSLFVMFIFVTGRILQEGRVWGARGPLPPPRTLLLVKATGNM